MERNYVIMDSRRLAEQPISHWKDVIKDAWQAPIKTIKDFAQMKTSDVICDDNEAKTHC